MSLNNLTHHKFPFVPERPLVAATMRLLSELTAAQDKVDEALHILRKQEEELAKLTVEKAAKEVASRDFQINFEDAQKHWLTKGCPGCNSFVYGQNNLVRKNAVKKPKMT